MLILSNSNEGQLIDSSKWIVSSAANIQEAHKIPAHQHHRAQLLFAPRSHVQVKMANKTWALTPHHAIWIPANINHEISSTGAAQYRSIFIEPMAASQLFHEPQFLQLTSVFTALINEAVQFGCNYQSDSPESRLLAVLYDQLQKLNKTLVPVVIPKDPRLVVIYKALVSNPADPRMLCEWATTCGASSRTLSRLFVVETGYSFTEWRQRLRVLTAISLLSEGVSVISVALELGYNSSSSFSTMFKRITGSPPRHYIL